MLQLNTSLLRSLQSNVLFAFLDLHRRLGPLVRIRPRHVSVGDPMAIPVIYGLNKGFTKILPHPMYIVEQETANEPLFSTRDEQFHRDQKRPIANSYSMTSLLELEPAVPGYVYYAFDVVGEFTFAKKLGFLQEDREVDGIMSVIQGILAYASLCGQIPEALKILLGNPLLPLLMPSMEGWNQVLQFTLKQVNSRTSLARDGELEKADLERGRDMLSWWMAIHYADPGNMSTRDVIVHLSTNVFAGSDATAIALRAIIYSLLRNPEIIDNVAEIDEVDRLGRLSSPISCRESMTHLPYLDAVFKEAMRLYPSVGLILERHVPKGGITVCGKHIPAGTTRWLEGTPEKLKEMEQSYFAFGAESRTCLLRDFTIRLHKPKEEWKTKNAWFVQQEGLVCDLETSK
ncbi:cytochrome P450 [Aspergillus spectabilis]